MITPHIRIMKKDDGYHWTIKMPDGATVTSDLGMDAGKAAKQAERFVKALVRAQGFLGEDVE